jgi:UDP-glucose 4-epimerase
VNSMNVAVTGGAGYIGSTLVKKLIDEGEGVVSIDNMMRGDYVHLRSVGAHHMAKLLVGDIRDIGLLKEAFSEAEAIAHLAALPGLVNCRDKPEDAVSINIYGTHQVLEAARKLDIKKVVFCSSAAVYGRPLELPVKEMHTLRPLNLYGLTKFAGEKLMDIYNDNYGIDTISLRFGNVFGVGLFTNYETVIPKFVKMGLDGEDLTIYGDGTSSRDYVHIQDIVQAILLSLRSKGISGEVYNVGGETMRIDALANHVVNALKEEIGKEVGITNLPPRSGETKEFSYTLKKIKKDLGYEPHWSVKEGIKQVLMYRIGQLKD